MSAYLLPALYTVLAWWIGTGAILYLDGLPRTTYKWSMTGATVLLFVVLCGLYATRNDTRITGAYLAFTCTLIAWGWKEMAFLMGFITGPRRTACPAGARGWARAGYAFMTLAWHELALLALGAAVLALTWGGANQVGAWTFGALWTMRLSAKLNLFFGVRNLYEEFLPTHLRYLETYFRRRSMNALFPAVIVIAGWVTFQVWSQALDDSATPSQAAGLTFAGTLLALAILEHLFLVLPLPTRALWSLGMRSRAAPGGCSGG